MFEKDNNKESDALKLFQIKKLHSFETPKGYFDKLENEILEKTTKNRFITNKKSSLNYLMYAASVTLFVFIGVSFFYNYYNFETQSKDNFKELTAGEFFQEVTYESSLEGDYLNLENVEMNNTSNTIDLSEMFE